MARQLQSFNSVRIDMLQALKRAYMHRGFLVGQSSRQRAEPESRSKNVKNDENSAQKQGPSPSELTGSPEPQEVHEKLIDITEKAQDVLFEAKSVFPFTLFPNSIVLDREKLTVVDRTFFWAAKITSVPVSSISSAEVSIGPLFGSLHMASKYFVQNKYSVDHLSRADAIRLQHLLQGFMIANEKGIDLTDIDQSDLLILLNDLGQGVKE